MKPVGNDPSRISLSNTPTLSFLHFKTFYSITLFTSCTPNPCLNHITVSSQCHRQRDMHLKGQMSGKILCNYTYAYF
ncbi:hypothetical protein PHYPO_G00221150 [Pangasianodon hypophthalmus]|uniref:Uncharacterized protein n=1 Tax=Pangasianodon hypophthalmus TaxID=310915 RepID=A0A5N5NUR0_PANHP|nr:hypothetical protein PHYPO_G00221150 [Pangasianodon hypophthalmus]